MKNFLQILLAVVVSVVLGLTVANLHRTVNDISESIDSLNETLDHIETAMESSYEEAIDKSLSHAPEGLTRWQLRGNAQKAAQAAMDRLTKKHNLPRYELSGLRWKGILHNPTAAGEATNCYVDGRGTGKHFPYVGIISLNEILFLRNYEEFMFIIIPHEVAHVFVCLNGSFVYDDNETDWEAEHGLEWEQAMKDLGFIDPTKFKNHALDMTPVIEYGDTLYKRLGEALGEKNVSEE